MNQKRKNISREIGLEVGSLCGQYFLKLNHLHYGYWNKDIEVDVANLHLAQDEYARFVISQIPEGVETILDVGCGTGQIAKMLIDKGYSVDCVSPSPFLSKRAGELLPDTSHIFECLYEDLKTANRYDVVLFCESFQYVDIQQALSITNNLLNSDGHLIICDMFRKDVEGKMIMGGGHRQSKFKELVEQFHFRLVKDLDITEQIAPNIELLNDVLEKVIEPSLNAVERLLKYRHPIAHKILSWKYKKKIEKLQQKYFSGGRTNEEFKKYKSYQLLVYQKELQ